MPRPTGLRRGELLGLRWQDVDLNSARVAIVQTLIDGERGAEDLEAED